VLLQTIALSVLLVIVPNACPTIYPGVRCYPPSDPNQATRRPLPASHRRTRRALRNAHVLKGSSDGRSGDRPGRFKRRRSLVVSPNQLGLLQHRRIATCSAQHGDSPAAAPRQSNHRYTLSLPGAAPSATMYMQQLHLAHKLPNLPCPFRLNMPPQSCIYTDAGRKQTRHQLRRPRRALMHCLRRSHLRKCVAISIGRGTYPALGDEDVHGMSRQIVMLVLDCGSEGP
jgi:hypothetical protein